MEKDIAFKIYNKIDELNFEEVVQDEHKYFRIKLNEELYYVGKFGLAGDNEAYKKRTDEYEIRLNSIKNSPDKCIGLVILFRENSDHKKFINNLDDIRELKIWSKNDTSVCKYNDNKIVVNGGEYHLMESAKNELKEEAKNISEFKYEENSNGDKWIRYFDDIKFNPQIILRYILPFSYYVKKTKTNNNGEEQEIRNVNQIKNILGRKDDKSNFYEYSMSMRAQSKEFFYDGDKIEIKEVNFDFYEHGIGFCWFEIVVSEELYNDIKSKPKEFIDFNRRLRTLNFGYRSQEHFKDVDKNNYHLASILDDVKDEAINGIKGKLNDKEYELNIQFKRKAKEKPTRAISFVYVKCEKFNEEEMDKKNFLYGLVHGNKTQKENIKDDIIEPLTSTMAYANKYGFAYVNWYDTISRFPYYDNTVAENYFKYYLESLYNYYVLDKFVTKLNEFVKSIDTTNESNTEKIGYDSNKKFFKSLCGCFDFIKNGYKDKNENKNKLLDKSGDNLKEIAIFMTKNMHIDVSEHGFEEVVYDYLRKQMRIDYHEEVVSRRIAVVDSICARQEERIERESNEKRDMALTTIGALAIFSAVCDGLDTTTEKIGKVFSENGLYIIPSIIVLLFIWRFSENLIKFIFCHKNE